MTRLEGLLASLREFYGTLPEPPRDPFRLFVWEVLSAHGTPQKRDAALAALKRIPALTPDAMRKAAPKKIEDSVRLAGAYLDQRLRALRAGVEFFRRTPRLASLITGSLSEARRVLEDLPQMGEQMGEGSAYRMLLFAADHPVLPVDARVHRVALRLGYGEADADLGRSARAIREAVARELQASADAYRPAFLYLAHHGAATCSETEPHCRVCPLLNDCPEGVEVSGARLPLS